MGIDCDWKGAERDLWDIGVFPGLDLSVGLTDGFHCETLTRCPLMVCVLFCMYIILYKVNIY